MRKQCARANERLRILDECTRFTNVKRVKKYMIAQLAAATRIKSILSLCPSPSRSPPAAEPRSDGPCPPPEFFHRALQFAKRLRHTRYAFPRTRIPLCSLNPCFSSSPPPPLRVPLCTLRATFAPTPLIPKLISRYGINNDIVGKRERSSNPEVTSTPTTVAAYDPITSTVSVCVCVCARVYF